MDLDLVFIDAAIITSTYAIIATIVVVTAVFTALWAKVIVPGARLITTVSEEVLPNVKYMKDLPKLNRVLTVVEGIAEQFRADSGSTLRDTTDRLEEHAVENKEAAAEAKQAAVDAQLAAERAQHAVEDAKRTAAEYARANRESITALEVLVGTIKEHAKDDRELARDDRDLARDALTQLQKLMASAGRTEESGARTEASGARIEAAREVVAEELAATQRRADDVEPHGPPGAAADAASQSPSDE